MSVPRFRSVALHSKSFGARAVDLAASAGLKADVFQADVVEAILAVDRNERFCHFESGVNMARQNGKGGILEIVELDALFNWPGENLIIHSAHEFATAMEHQRRLESLVQNCPELHSKVKAYRHSNGTESIVLKSGSRIIFKARTKGGSRGFSGDLLVWDEAMVLPDHVVGAMMPTLRASQAPYGPMVIYAGSAVDQEVHEYGVVWAKIRERGMAGDPGLAYFEWSAHVDDLADLTDDMLMDRRLWAQANPALGGRIDPDHMARELQSMPIRTAAVELLGVGDWPRTDGVEDTMISLEQWGRLEDRKSKLQEPFCLAFDVSPERKTSIAIAGRNQHDMFHVEIQECKTGTGWVVDRIVQMVERGNPEVVVCDATGPASSLLVALTEAGVHVETVSSTDHGRACGRLVDMVTDGNLAHLGSSELRDALRGSKSRSLGDAWAWDRKHSSVDISPLVAATLALGAAAGIAVGELAIY